MKAKKRMMADKKQYFICDTLEQWCEVATGKEEAIEVLEHYVKTSHTDVEDIYMCVATHTVERTGVVLKEVKNAKS